MIVRLSASGERLSVVRVANEAVAISAAVVEAGPNPEVVIEATYGWYWVVDLLQELGGRRWRRVFREAGDHRVGAMRTPMMRTCLQPVLDGLLSVERACSRFDRWMPESQSASGPRRESTGSSPRRSASM